MARYVIDAPTLLDVVDRDLWIDPSHQLVAPNSIRSEALQCCCAMSGEASAPTGQPFGLTNG